ncbi:MAG: response regulator transcription factor [Lachnospiraceae bacterium]|nr:response regulator transcription factor [Lachnospiraceae bacterium]
MKLLILEDDLELCSGMEKELKNNGYVVDVCHDGETGMQYALNKDYSYDLAIVDRMLPFVDGLTIIKAMREKGIQIPAIIITGMSALNDRIEGLDGGADDYLSKPFHIEELLARIRALTRRPAELLDFHKLTYADLCLDMGNRTVSSQTHSIVLTAKETALLTVFIQKPDTLFTREYLLQKIWGTSSDIELGNVDNYISFLRKRLRELKSHCEIKTVYGAGYKLENRNA